jgi:restriction system protein
MPSPRTPPWNPPESADISAKEYELQVANWLKATALHLDRFTVTHLKHIEGVGGDYEFDAVAEFTSFHEARFTVLVECKRCARPVERERVLALWAKLQAVSAHKAMMFATSGFQSGAIEYASEKGIATVTFMAGKFNYHTRGAMPGATLRLPPGLPEYVGVLVALQDGVLSGKTIDESHSEPLLQWLTKKEEST